MTTDIAKLMTVAGPRRLLEFRSMPKDSQRQALRSLPLGLTAEMFAHEAAQNLNGNMLRIRQGTLKSNASM